MIILFCKFKYMKKKEICDVSMVLWGWSYAVFHLINFPLFPVSYISNTNNTNKIKVTGNAFVLLKI